jgi:hypothetical protein
MSDSSIRVKPSIDEPSNWISPGERLLELGAGHLDVLDDPQDVRELEAQEPDAFLVTGLQDFGGFHSHRCSFVRFRPERRGI